MTWWQAVLAYIVGPVVVALGSVYAAKLASRGSVNAADRTAEVQEDTNAIEGMDRLVHNLETRLDKVEQRAEKLADRVETLERERARDKSLIRYLYAYARQLRDALMQINAVVPEPPAGLDLDEPSTTS